MQQKSELPEGWVWTKLEVLTDLFSGKAFKKSEYSESGIRLLQIANVSFGRALWENLSYMPFSYLEQYPELVLNSGDILMALNRPILDGKLKIALLKQDDVPSILYQRVGRFDFYEPKMKIYFFYYAQAQFFTECLRSLLQGVDQPFINKSKLLQIPFPLSPLAEQHRIVSAIEALFARLDATNEKLDRVPEILKKFRESVLATACEGKLTKEWRKENLCVKNQDDYLKEINEIRIKCSKKDELKFKTISELDICDLSELPDSWLWIPSNVIFSYVTSGSRGWAKYYSDSGSIFLRIGNLDRNSIYLKLEDIQRVNPPDSAEGRRTRIQKDDILISITADIGSIGYICEELGDAYINQHIALARPVQNLNPKYIAYFLHSQTGGKKQFEKLHRGATKIGLGLDDIRSIAIPLPPLPEQQEIVRRVDALFAFADSIEAKVTVTREKTEKLRQSILAKAFSGQLVETEAAIAKREGRDYETAEVLLERIKKKKRGEGEKKR